jgi:hypothetical protein
MKYGLYTLIIENHLKKSMMISGLPKHYFEYGWGNGYVLLPKNHPFYKVHYDNINVYAHGGLTYSELFKSEYFLKWIENLEFDGDVTYENFKFFDDYWVIGFDTSHYGDNEYNCHKSYVMNETIDLMNQCLDNNVKSIKKYKKQYISDNRKNKIKKINSITT